MFVRQQGRGGRGAAASAGELAARLVGVLQQDPTAPAFLLTIDAQSRTLVVRRVAATPEPGKSYELWLIAGQKSRSLGLVGKDEFTQRADNGELRSGDAARGELRGIARAPGRLAERGADRSGAVHRQTGRIRSGGAATQNLNLLR